MSHPPEDHRMKLQSSHSEEVELHLSQSDDIDVRGEVSQERQCSDLLHCHFVDLFTEEWPTIIISSQILYTINYCDSLSF